MNNVFCQFKKSLIITRFEDIEASLSLGFAIFKYSIVNSGLSGWDLAGTQFVFADEHQIFVPEMRRDTMTTKNDPRIGP